jgi:glutaminyl-peptide cyclotransferase
MKVYLFVFVIISTFLGACGNTSGNQPTNNLNKNTVNSAPAMKKDLPVYTYEIVNTYKHDRGAFTEGLFFYNGFLYESTGENGKSDLRKVELETGKVVKSLPLAREIFGEGTTILNDKIYQLSWQNGKAFVYDLNFTLLKEFSYVGEGWGLTNDGTNLIMSDGTNLIKFIDPETFKTLRTLAVFRAANKPLFLINELEYIKGELWANIWQSETTDTQTTQGTMQNIGKPNYIVRFDPKSGDVLGWVDLDKISPSDSGRDYENSLNGIAYDAATDRIFVTGKNWKNLFEIKVKPKS